MKIHKFVKNKKYQINKAKIVKIGPMVESIEPEKKKEFYQGSDFERQVDR
jgi:hypothetical protein